MFMRRANKRAQTTAEYAVLLGLVIAAVLAMQVYVKRSLQGKIKEQADEVGNQYEPYYLSSDFTSNRDGSQSSTLQTGGSVGRTLSDRASRTGTQTYGVPRQQ